jgi:hypothetical protein
MAEWWHRFLAALGVGKTEADASYDPVVQDTRDGGTPGPGGSDLGESTHQKPRNWPPDDRITGDGARGRP